MGRNRLLRHSLAIIVGTIVLSLSTGAVAQASTITTGGGGGVIIVSVGGNGPGNSPPSGPSTPPKAGFVNIYVPFLISHAGTSLSRTCVSFKALTMKVGSAATLELEYATSEWNLLLARFPRCIPLVSTTPPPTPSQSPSSLASQIWLDTYIHQLPHPQATIPPGYGVVNVASYIVTANPNGINFVDQTPLGTLNIEATSTFQASNPNGSIVTTTANEGLPWPNGSLIVTWPGPGSYNLIISETWHARWSLGASSGTFAPQVTQSVISNFPVKALSAIRLLPTSSP